MKILSEALAFPQYVRAWPQRPLVIKRVKTKCGLNAPRFVLALGARPGNLRFSPPRPN